MSNAKYVLKWGTPIPNDPLEVVLRAVNEKIIKRTNGEVEIEFHIGVDDKDKALITMVEDGDLDIVWTMSEDGGKTIGLHHCEAGQLPIWPSGQAGAEFTKRVVDKYCRPEMEARGATPIVMQFNSCANFDYYTILYYAQVWTKEKYNSLEDLKGKKIFCQHGTTAAAMGALGAIPVTCTYLYVPDYLRDGTIDGVCMSSMSMLGLNLQDELNCCFTVNYPQTEDNFSLFNKKKWESMPQEYRDIVLEEWRGWEMAVDRLPMYYKALEYWDAREKAGTFKRIRLTPSQQEMCDKIFYEECVHAWIQRHEYAGMKDAREYIEDLQKMAAEVVATGLPQYLGPRL